MQGKVAQILLYCVTVMSFSLTGLQIIFLEINVFDKTTDFLLKKIKK